MRYGTLAYLICHGIITNHHGRDHLSDDSAHHALRVRLSGAPVREPAPQQRRAPQRRRIRGVHSDGFLPHDLRLHDNEDALQIAPNPVSVLLHGIMLQFQHEPHSQGRPEARLRDSGGGR